VTAETALALPTLFLVVGLLLVGLGQGLDHVRATDAARSAARLLARGEGGPGVESAARAEAPRGAVVEVRWSGEQVTVTVRAPGRALLPGWHLPEVVASATVVAESGTGPGP
jgi:hypothetical protein